MILTEIKRKRKIYSVSIPLWFDEKVNYEPKEIAIDIQNSEGLNPTMVRLKSK